MQSSPCEELYALINRAHQMQRESHTLGTPSYQYNPVQTTEVMPHDRVSNPGHELLTDEHIPGPTFTGPYAAMNTGFRNHTQHNGYPFFQVAGYTEEEQAQYVYQDNQNVAHLGPPTGIAQYISDRPISPGPFWPEYYAPPVQPQGMLNDGTIGRVAHPSNITVPFQGIPGPVPPGQGMSVEEELRQLARRYLQNPDSRRSGKVKVMLVLELDDVE